MKKFIFPVCAVVVVAIAAVGSAQAQLINIPIPNASFESPADTTPGSPFDTSDSGQDILDWTGLQSDGTGQHNPFGLVNNSTLTSPGTSDGDQAAYVQVYFNSSNTKLTTTDSLLTIAPDTTYTLTVALGAPVAPSTLGGVIGTAGETAPQINFSLLGDGVAFATTSIANTDVPVGTLQDYSVTFTTGATGGPIGEALTIQLEALKASYTTGKADPGSEAAIFDNVRLTETPEPATWALMLGGIGFLILLARRNLLRA